MALQTLDTGFFKLDGGAMFGVVPKPLWQKLNPADELNRCTWAMRCLLYEQGNRLLLVDTGIGTKQDAKFFGHYDLHGDASLLDSIAKAGYSTNDVTDVLLTHLHFDHVGGAVERNGDRLKPLFDKATYWVHPSHWDWAVHPNPREKASFLYENIMPLQESGQLTFLSEQRFPYTDIQLLYVDGHTEKMTLPVFQINGRTVAYMADLIPSSGHIPLPYVMSYDVRPLLTMEEKTQVLQKAAAENWILVFEHDPITEAATVEMTEKGVRIKDKGRLSELL
ncbi:MULTISPECIES: MBL fold metallo-hydrolase [unclassified Spirosoma]|uniref:MBL fold metallo-hydrolase n=1 Tax=unclassified Spirosoma TaxID=2621999 RepID=UPI00095C7052|nr:MULTISPECIES: MBL fold metallo-hydrolase [unclassified Spirosoma]MBN8822185.1 MBL fold metallo-hydrolase [Spirosoma sp.]OJW80578.1 MAG: MBL fold metallo-hydrolase [Spirosoma sp. 48-14]